MTSSVSSNAVLYVTTRLKDLELANASIEVVTTVQVGPIWINHCAWSQWSSLAPGSCEALDNKDCCLLTKYRLFMVGVQSH
jgi:hypothetical protein